MQKRDLNDKILYESILSKDNEFITGTKVHLEGWVKTNRDNGSVGFIEFNDGTFFKNAQLVYSKEFSKDFDACSKLQTGASIHVDGKFVLTPEAKQPFEIQVYSITLLGAVDPDYPLQKKRHSFEFLRDIAHL